MEGIIKDEHHDAIMWVEQDGFDTTECRCPNLGMRGHFQNEQQ
jgi:hypothetical protein